MQSWFLTNPALQTHLAWARGPSQTVKLKELEQINRSRDWYRGFD
jgi:hypothetical protein